MHRPFVLCANNDDKQGEKREGKQDKMEGRLIGGRYEYIKSLGKGGNGSVFLCYDIKLQKEWAVKEIKERTSEPEILKKIACNLFPRIVDIVYEQEGIYLVMDYVEGITLKEKMQRHRLTEKEVYSWAIQIANALMYLHKMSPQMLYMDCKPENIILTSEGEIRLVDLGSVYICDSKKEQRISGTGFFSPIEQKMAGKQKGMENDCESRPDVRSDIYAFGMTMYYLLAGEKKIYRRRGKLSLRDANPTVSEGMNVIVARCTEHDPSKRFQTMEEVLYQLMHIREVGRAQKIRQRVTDALSMIGKILCAAGILAGAYYCKNVETAYPVLTAFIILFIFSEWIGRRRFTLYEMKQEVFCGSGKRVLLYVLILLGVMRCGTMPALAMEPIKTVQEREVEEVQILPVTLYDSLGRKLLLKNDAIWRISEDIRLVIPVEEVAKTGGRITILYEDISLGTEKKYTFLCEKK